MKKILSTCFVLFFVINCFAQIKFEKGYFIANDGSKNICLIRNSDWLNNPTEFSYTDLNDQNLKTGQIDNVAEFAIDDGVKFIRASVDIDQSSEETSKLSEQESPEFQEKQVFLKVLVEGKANLYVYKSSLLTKYFFSTADIPLEQLIFKSYINSNSEIYQNNAFRKRLSIKLVCDGILQSSFEKLNYNRNDLIKLFTRYNNCQNGSNTLFTKNQNQSKINLYLRPGLNFSNLNINNSRYGVLDAKFENKASFRLGLEVEFIAGFNKDKWAVFVEPVYREYNAKSITSTSNAKVGYKSVELSAGIRHYLFLDQTSKIFIEAALVNDFPMKSKINYGFNSELIIKSTGNAAFGLGYNYNSRYSLGFKYFTTRNILKNFLYWRSNFNTTSIVFGYNFLKKKHS